MKNRRTWAIVGAIATLMLVAAACSDVDEGGGSTGATSGEVPDNSGTTINLSVSPWVGSAANANVAKILLENELGYTVEFTEIDEYGQFPALANGDIDATLEVWPSGHAKDYKKYIDTGKVVDLGPLGVDGQIGWYIPTYLLDQYPELATWEGIKGNEQLFQTAESGDSGQLLDGDPSFVTFDQPIADNLGLDLKVIYAGSEAAQLSALKDAFQNEDPFLFYFWTPHWAHAQFELSLVELPAVTDACTTAASDNADDYACAYPPDSLYKAANADLQTKAPAAFAFLEAMEYTNEDQNEIGIDISNGDAEAKYDVTNESAAQKWIDANSNVWQPWVDAGLAAQSA